MQTILLAAWPLLNLLLFAGLVGAAGRFIQRSVTSRFTQFGLFLVLILIPTVVLPPALLPKDRQFVIEPVQLALPIAELKFHSGLLFTSLLFTIKSHISLWPVTPSEKDSSAIKKGGSTPSGAGKVTLTMSTPPMIPGLAWEPEDVRLLVATTGQLTYTVQGNLVWRLLTIPIYHQPKNYVGTMAI